MSDDTARVRMVTPTGDGRFNQIETREMTRREAEQIAAEAVGRGIPAQVHKA